MFIFVEIIFIFFKQGKNAQSIFMFAQTSKIINLIKEYVFFKCLI